MNWFMNNWVNVLAIATSAVTLASMVTALTKTPKDDSVVLWIRKILDVIAMNVGNAKNAPKDGRDVK